MDPVQHQDVFSKGLQGEFCQLQPYQVKIYLIFPPKSPTEILKLTPQRRHVSELAACLLQAMLTFFEVREEFFPTAFIRLNLETALSRFREQCSLEDLEFKMSRN